MIQGNLDGQAAPVTALPPAPLLLTTICIALGPHRFAGRAGLALASSPTDIARAALPIGFGLPLRHL